ncbi:hypothetical protein PLESTB_000921300 [Pleodorina starrii]|uniref:Major facilitator superfamily (MFS) profile domain-containing protein n=1 Tax=Pleodorina starrii TaxID=330485 RepID=A0A9W6BMD1_9CHLO|nr:hypothetical protein PLESTM_001532200 [Pleodorina starrii]GLC54926.1 hypothetical protein PLESTB_000921300 [Pleodorina starrii]
MILGSGAQAGVLAGHLSDKSGASATVATSFTLLSVPCLYMYRTAGHTSFALNVALMMASGFFVNGPYALITTAVSADLGTHDSLQGVAKALATVSAIIDGMGSIGAALGPMLTGFISNRGGFDMVFVMLYTSAVTAGLLLVKLVIKELAVMRDKARVTRSALAPATVCTVVVVVVAGRATVWVAAHTSWRPGHAPKTKSACWRRQPLRILDGRGARYGV